MQQALPVALRAITRAEDFKRKKYAGSHQEVVPLGFSAGGACLERTWNALPFDPKGAKEAKGGQAIRDRWVSSTWVAYKRQRWVRSSRGGCGGPLRL